MATRKTTRKPATTRRRRTPAQTKGKIDFMKAAKNLKTPILFILGLVGGKQIGMFVDRNKTIKGIAGPDGKKFITPALQMLIGMTVPQVIKNEDLKIIGYGVAASGLVKAVNEATGKKILDVLSGDSDDALPVYLEAPSNAPAMPIDDIDFEQVFTDPSNEVPAPKKDPVQTAPVSGLGSQMESQYPSDSYDEAFSEEFDDDALDGGSLS